MKRIQILSRPTKVDDLELHDLEQRGVNYDWQDKAERLQARRWRMIRRAMREGSSW